MHFQSISSGGGAWRMITHPLGSGAESEISLYIPHDQFVFILKIGTTIAQGACCQHHCPEFDSQDPYGGRKEITPLTSTHTCARTHTLSHTQAHVNKIKMKVIKKLSLKSILFQN